MGNLYLLYAQHQNICALRITTKSKWADQRGAPFGGTASPRTGARLEPGILDYKLNMSLPIIITRICLWLRSHPASSMDDGV